MDRSGRRIGAVDRRDGCECAEPQHAGRRLGDKQGTIKQGPAQASEKDAPPSTATTGAGASGAPKAPAMNDKSSIHQSAGDRDSRDFPKTK